MAYQRVTWVNEETPLNANNMNNIEDGIEECMVEEAVKVLFASIGWVAPSTT